MGKLLSWIGWLLVAVAGAGAFAWLALSRGEQVSAAWLVTAAVCTYLIAYRFYSKFIASKIFALVTATLLAVATVASCIPAMRAATLDPKTALQSD